MNSTGRKRSSSFVTAACAASRPPSFCAPRDFRRSLTLPAASMRGRKRSILMFRDTKVGTALLLIVSLGALSGCDRMITQRQIQLGKDADAKTAEGNYAQAINLYEAALDGSAGSADV